MAPMLLFVGLLAAAVALLALALWLDDTAIGVVSASIFLILGGILFSGSLIFESGKDITIDLSSNSTVFGNLTETNSTTTTTETITERAALPGFLDNALALVFVLLGLYIIIKLGIGDS